MYAIIHSMTEILRVQDSRLHRRGAGSSGLLIAILAAIGLLVVLSYVF